MEKDLKKLRKPQGSFAPGDLVDVFANSTQGTTLNAKGELTNNHYDHFIIVFPADTKEKISETVIDGRSQVPNGTAPTAAKRNEYYEQAVSDHLPIEVTFSAAGPDDD